MGLMKLLFGRLKLKFIIIASVALMFVIKWKFPEYFIPVFIFFMIIILLIIGWMAVKALSAGSFLLKMNSGKLTEEEKERGLANLMKGTEQFFGKGFASTVQSATTAKEIPNGIPATATVISARQENMKMKVGVQEIFQLVIEVTVATQSGETWQAVLTEMIPLAQIAAFQPGVSFAVKYDPNNKTNICIDQNQQTKRH